MHLFTATGWTGRIREDCDEGVLGWIHRDRLAALPQWEGTASFWSCCGGEVPFFSLKLRYEGSGWPMPPSTEGRWNDEAAGQCVSAGSGLPL